MASSLRDLAYKIKELTRGHAAHGKAWEAVRSCADHLEALARVEEINQGNRPSPPDDIPWVWLREIDAGTDNACWVVCNQVDPGSMPFRLWEP